MLLITGGQIQLHDLLVGEVVQVLHHAPQGVPVGRDQHPLSGPEVAVYVSFSNTSKERFAVES